MMLQLISSGGRGDGGLTAVVDDPSPVLGGNLDAAGKNILNISLATFASAGSRLISTDGIDLTLTQTGDTYGSSSLSLRSRNGAAGAIFISGTLDLVDFGFQGSSGAQGNLRFEHRAAYSVGGDPDGELEYVHEPLSPANVCVPMVVSGSKILFSPPATFGYIASGAKVGFGCTDPTTLVDINRNVIRLRTPATPASAGAGGTQGFICWDANYIYVCVATNTWKRAALAAW